MSKKNIHIKKYLNGDLPEPEIQADDAWAKMNDMLGGNPVPDSQVSISDKLKFLVKVGLGMIAAAGIATTIWLLAPKEKVNNNLKQTNGSSLNNSGESLANRTQTEHISLKNGQKNDSLKQSQISKDEAEEKKSGVGNAKTLDVKNNSVSISLKSSGIKTDFRDTKNSQKPAGSEKNSSAKAVNKRLSSSRLKNTFKTNSEFKNRSNLSADIKVNVKNQQSSNRPTGSKNNPSVPPEKDNIILPNRILFSVKTLLPKSPHFHNLAVKQTRQVTYSEPISTKKPESKKTKKPLFQTLHAGLEWNAASSINSTKYILTGTDSTSKPYLLLIPGIWITKDITENQVIRLSFYANQPFYGGSKRIQRIGGDSALFHNNINLVKASGINLALQYEYQFFPKITASAGFAYSPLRKALAKDAYENYQGIIISGPKLLLNKENIDQYMNTNLFTFKTGLTFSPGRFQFGVNMLIPLSNLSLTPTSSLRTLNGQLYFRFTIK